MTAQLWWYLARSAGIVAWALATASVVWGLLLATRLLSPRPRRAWLLDLHRHLGGLTVAFVAIHVTAIVADSYTHFGLADVTVPMASDWRPGAVAWGIVAAYLLVAVEATSLVMRRLPRRTWHLVHLTSFVVFWAASLHGAFAGADAANVPYAAGSIVSIAVVTSLTLYRITRGRRAAGPVRSPEPDPVALTATLSLGAGGDVRSTAARQRARSAQSTGAAT